MHPNLVAAITFLIGIIALVALANDNFEAFTVFLTLFAIGTLILHILFQQAKSTPNQNNNEEL